MDIKFLLPNNTLVDFPDDAKEYFEKSTFSYYLSLKNLEFNDEFNNYVERIREEERIDPIHYRDYILLGFYREIIKENEEIKSQSSNILDEVLSDLKIITRQELSLKIRIDLADSLNLFKYYENNATNWNALAEIILFDTVCVRKGLPAIYWIPRNGNVPGISIEINANVSKAALLNFISEEFDQKIKPAMEKLKLPYRNKVKFPKRGYEILKLRKKGNLKFSEIAKQYDYLLEDDVRQAYHRALKKIQNL
jgi:hypothetical protein